MMTYLVDHGFDGGMSKEFLKVALTVVAHPYSPEPARPHNYQKIYASAGCPVHVWCQNCWHQVLPHMAAHRLCYIKGLTCPVCRKSPEHAKFLDAVEHVLKSSGRDALLQASEPAQGPASPLTCVATCAVGL